MSLHLRRLLVAISIVFPSGSGAQDTGGALSQAIAAAGAGDWTAVSAARAGVRDQISRDIVDWFRLRGRQGTFGECRDFVARHGTPADPWPGMPLLSQRCEASIPRGSDPEPVLAFFRHHSPRTGTGSLRLGEALIRTGRAAEAAKELQRAWLTLPMSADEHDAFVERNGLTIQNLHEARLDSMLWNGFEQSARRMYPLVGEDWRKLAEARLTLRDNGKGVDGLIAAVPAKLADDPGLAFERFAWRARKGRDADAIELLLDRSATADRLGRPEDWANRRRSFARQEMRAGNFDRAYRLAAQNHLQDGSDYADLEWLAGFIALRKLNDPDRAVTHFERFRAAVESPISLGRAGYWLGRAHAAAGRSEKAAEAYEFGARYQSSFYGQLAAEAAGLPTDAAMTGAESLADWNTASFTSSSVFKAAILLYDAGMNELAERFLVHLSERLSRTDLGALSALALDLKEPHVALMIAKQAAQQGHEIYASYFPISTPHGLDIPVPNEFALSIARRESEFNPVVISGAGARGLMQLMPGTAKEMAANTGEEYSAQRLLTDPAYNARLGTAYLAELAARYQGNPVLMSVAYNAGPSRADRWMRELGDPRSADVDVIDWIESVPFRETQNYIMRVTESFAPYRARISGKTEPIRLSRELKR